QVLAFLQRNRSAVDFRNVTHDGEAETGPRFASIKPRAAFEDGRALFGRDAAAIILDQDFGRVVAGYAHGDEHAAAAIFGRILDEVTEQLIQILPLDTHRDVLV